MKSSAAEGFTLIELAIVVTVIGIILAFSIPSLDRVSQTQLLYGAGENVAGQLRLAREKAVATATNQVFCFSPDSAGADYHVHATGGGLAARWNLPVGITFVGITTPTPLVLQKDGSVSNSMTLILQDRQGVRDTVSIEVSGLVLAR